MASSKKPAPDPLILHLQQRLIAARAPGQRLTLGLSGGLESVVLLHLLLHLREALALRLSALHVNHQISPHAAAWAEFCRGLCAAHGVPLQVTKVAVPRRTKIGLEAAARAARYRAFADCETDVLLLAHHLDDQAETLLQNLLRGTGLAGASGMAEERTQTLPGPAGRVHVLRPLIDVARADLFAYATRHGLRWVEDDSNADTAFARNFLRHEVLPVIERRYPAYRVTLARAAQHFAEAQFLLAQLAQEDLTHLVRHERLDLAGLGRLQAARARNALRGYLQAQGVPALDSARLQDWLRQLLEARGDRVLDLGVQGLRLRRYRGEAWVEAQLPAPLPDWRTVWRGERDMRLKELGGTLHWVPGRGSGLSLAKLQQAVTVAIALRQGGEKFRPDRARPRRTLKHLLQEAGVPPWRRTRLPLIYCDGQLAAVPGIGVDCAFQAAGDEPSLSLCWEVSP